MLTQYNDLVEKERKKENERVLLTVEEVRETGCECFIYNRYSCKFTVYKQLILQVYHIGAMGSCCTWISLYIRDRHIVTGILHIRTISQHRSPFMYVHDIPQIPNIKPILTSTFFVY